MILSRELPVNCLKASIDILMDEMEPAVTKKHQIECQHESELVSFFGIAGPTKF